MKNNERKRPSEPIKNKNIKYPKDDQSTALVDFPGQEAEGIFG